MYYESNLIEHINNKYKYVLRLQHEANRTPYTDMLKQFGDDKFERDYNGEWSWGGNDRWGWLTKDHFTFYYHFVNRNDFFLAAILYSDYNL